MPNSTRLSAASASSRPRSGSPGGSTGFVRPRVPEARIEWRPSRWLLTAILVLGVLAAFSILASEMPRPLAWPLALAALVHGTRLFRRERRRTPLSFVLRGEATPALVDGVAVEGFELQWRGPLAFARWCDRQGRCQRRTWWPDTLPSARRRELRLAAPVPRAARGGASMAT